MLNYYQYNCLFFLDLFLGLSLDLPLYLSLVYTRSCVGVSARLVDHSH